MTERFSDFDLADLLKADAAIEVFLADAFETGDSAHIASAIGTVARAKGMTKVAKETGLAREQLYRSLSENGNPTLETTLAVLKSLGFQLTAKQSVA
ncbi:addiction module antidote protein [Affinirhizobium pseudoryzae]|uniref:addiction module antidote protein n=1 Tax=Allorhizobium pseudoryzae TaxID=379684 RepID=UPI0013E9C329|nr:addiction module antidote protein [Allorhizobium pseudoryzae]